MPLQIDVEGKLQVEAADLVGESVAVLGIKGSGKTNTAAVLIEELLVAGLPLTIVDPEGEYWGLKERFEILVVGQGDHVDMEIDTDQVAGLAEFSVRQGVPVILNLEGYDRDEAAALLQRYLRTLWQVCFQVRRPYELVLEEAHEFVPQGVRTPVKEILARIALRGRKRGLGLISISQRSARVDKDLLTQAAVLFLHQVVHPVDMKVYQDLIPLPPREVEEQVRQLARGQAIALLHNQVQVARIRVRHTFHVGATPGLDRATQPELRRIDAGLLDELRRLMAANRENVEKAQQERRPHQDAQPDEVRRLEDVIAQQRAEIERLQAQVETLTQQLAARTNALTPTTEPTDEGYLSSRAQARAVTVQTKRFEQMIQRIRRQKPFHRAILCLLLEHEGQAMDAQELARRIDVAYTTIRNDPPVELVRMGLISRTRTKSSEPFKYASTTRKLLETEYPNLALDEMLDRILATE